MLSLRGRRHSRNSPRSGTLEFVGLQGTVARMRLNVGTTDDGKRFRDHHLL
jgi:hypothetical protein